MRAVVAVTVAAVGSAMLARSSIPVLDVSGTLHRSVYQEGDIRNVAACGMKASSANRRLAEVGTRCRSRSLREHLGLPDADRERLGGQVDLGGSGLPATAHLDEIGKRSGRET